MEQSSTSKEDRTMLWPKDFVPDPQGLLPGGSPETITKVETTLSMSLPKEFAEFLLWADGGCIANNRFIIYSAGKGTDPSETLVAANTCREPDFPLLLVGRDSQEEFGFRKEDLPANSCSVYFYLHEEGRLDKVADSFKDFVRWIFK
jgi:hypothetical protein